ncbi:MAG: 2-dehydro-3-deoxygalactonokinase [Deltaproteobacteria bacterium]|nr:2-dehydro-3-deoxygalactonokinase [Deltaproteobacteria bacterium]
MFAVIDCGTTNSRVYVIDENERIVGQSSAQVGVRDVAVSGTKQVLKDGLKQVFIKAAESVPVPLQGIEFAIASGMITSEIGLLEIPHLIAPVGIDELVENIRLVKDEQIFPLDIPIIFIRGVKNNLGRLPVFGDLRKLDFLRGEEVQTIGLLHHLNPLLPLNIVFLSSHTKLVHVNTERKIAGCITTISGQIYEALKQTSIAKSIFEHPTDGGVGLPTALGSEEILEMAYESVQKAGLLRALLMPRFMQTLLVSTVAERLLFTEAAIAADDMHVFDELAQLGFHSDTNYILIGQETRCNIHAAFIHKKLGRHCQVEIVSKPEKIAEFTVGGAIEIARRVTGKIRPPSEESYLPCEKRGGHV